MTKQKQKARWGKASVNPNGSLREAIQKCREAALGLREYAEEMHKKADELEAGEGTANG